MKRSKAVLFFILVCAIGVCSQTPPEATTPKSSSTEVWQTFELAKGHFKILLPAKPTESINNDGGITSYLYIVPLDRGTLLGGYSLLEEDAETWSAEGSKSFYEGFWEGFSKSFEEEGKNEIKLESQEKVVFAGSDGVEFKFSLRQFRGRFLITRIGRHSYFATVFATESFSREDQDKFINSYKILTPAKTESGKP